MAAGKPLLLHNTLVIRKMAACKMATTRDRGSLFLARFPRSLNLNISHSKFGQIDDHILRHNEWILEAPLSRNMPEESPRNNATILLWAPLARR
jgi:hypothetical protein